MARVSGSEWGFALGYLGAALPGLALTEQFRIFRLYFFSDFTPLPWWPRIGTYGQRQGIASMVLRGSGLCHQQGQLLFPPILDQSEGFFDRIDDERMFVRPHAVRDFGYFLMSVLIEFYRNLDVIHKCGD